MGFGDFHGNATAVRRLREMIARDRLPHAIILAGPEGSGKYTLAQMVAKALNCLERPSGDLPDFCGQCSNCTRIAQADALGERFAEAVETRENLREADKRDTRIFVQTHPEVLIIPPDPPQMLVKVDQVRHLTAGIYYRPAIGTRKVFIFPAAAFVKEAANALLKVLEEPPEYATIFLLAENSSALLPTIRSRCVTLHLAPLAVEEIEQDLKSRADLAPVQRKLVARLSGGAVGRARSFDLPSYLAARQNALLLLTTAVESAEHSALYRATESYRAGAEGKSRTDALLFALHLLLQDLLFLQGGTPELVRNTDLEAALRKMAHAVSFEWLETAAARLGEVQSGMRRNLLRSLALDAFSASLES